MISFADFINICEIDSVLEVADLMLEEDPGAVLNPKTGKPWRHAERWTRLQQIIDNEKAKGVDPDRIWVHFTDIQRLNMRPQIRSGKSTPYGIFAYPAMHVLSRQGAVESFSNRPYAIVFRADGETAEVGNTSTDEDKEYAKTKVKDQENKESSNLANYLNKTKNGVSNVVNKWAAKGSSKRYEMRSFLVGMVNDMFEDINQAYTNAGATSFPAKVVNDDDDDDDDEGKVADQNEPTREDKVKAAYAQLAKYNSENFAQEEKEGIKKKFYDALSNAKISYTQDNKYQNVSPEDFSFELTPQFREVFQKKLDSGHYYGSSAIKPILEKPRLTLDDLRAIDSSFFDSYYPTGKIYLKYMNSTKGFYESKITKQLVGIAAKHIKKTLDKFAAFKQHDLKYPYEDKLKQFANKHNLDFKQALNASEYAQTAKQFLYQAAKALAQQIHAKNPQINFQSAWTNLFRELGFSGIVDTKGSGQIHSSEPKQGVFFDPAKITQLATISNVRYSGFEDMSGRPRLTGGLTKKANLVANDYYVTLSDVKGISTEMLISGDGIPKGSYVVSIQPPDKIQISYASQKTGPSVLSFSDSASDWQGSPKANDWDYSTDTKKPKPGQHTRTRATQKQRMQKAFSNPGSSEEMSAKVGEKKTPVARAVAALNQRFSSFYSTISPTTPSPANSEKLYAILGIFVKMMKTFRSVKDSVTTDDANEVDYELMAIKTNLGRIRQKLETWEKREEIPDILKAQITLAKQMIDDPKLSTPIKGKVKYMDWPNLVWNKPVTLPIGTHIIINSGDYSGYYGIIKNINDDGTYKVYISDYGTYWNVKQDAVSQTDY